MSDSDPVTFRALGLPDPLVAALDALGYETPSPIQAETMPHLLAGRDLIGQAQTGTGKTAAFALPVLSRIELERAEPQVLVLAPTRELALQVAEAFQSYARNLSGFHVLPIYGGQSYDTQLRQLRRGVHVVVGTPGRVMDHIERGTLKLDGLTTLVLDEADEMLRMGFIDDVDWILKHTPATRQVALFSATMPKEIRRVAQTHLRDPVEIKIASKTSTAATIRQRYWPVSGLHKLDALTRILESEPFEAMLVFVRTKTATLELAEKLGARGFSAEALNGDIAQAQREKIVSRLKAGKLDVVVATDVAARGLDVERISHVVNYDIPYDTEAYVHRIGRTGRAGRSGEAILFVAPREKRMLFSIEKATGQPIEPMQMPSASDINRFRIQRFGQRIQDVMASADLSHFEQLLDEFRQANDVEPMRIAAALAYLMQGDSPLLLSEQEAPRREREQSDRSFREPRDEREDRRPRRSKAPPEAQAMPLKGHPEIAMQRFHLDVGHVHGVRPGNIVGAIANEADLESRYIGHIEIYDDYSIVDLPSALDKATLHTLQKARVCGIPLGLRPFGQPPAAAERAPAARKPRKPRAEPVRERPPVAAADGPGDAYADEPDDGHEDNIGNRLIDPPQLPPTSRPLLHPRARAGAPGRRDNAARPFRPGGSKPPRKGGGAGYAGKSAGQPGGAGYAGQPGGHAGKPGKPGKPGKRKPRPD